MRKIPNPKSRIPKKSQKNSESNEPEREGENPLALALCSRSSLFGFGIWSLGFIFVLLSCTNMNQRWKVNLGSPTLEKSPISTNGFMNSHSSKKEEGSISLVDFSISSSAPVERMLAQAELPIKSPQPKKESLEDPKPAEEAQKRQKELKKASKEGKKDNPDEGLMLNFDSADIYEVIHAIFGEILKLNYMIDPRVAGNITIHTTKKVRKKDLLSIMKQILKINGFTIIEDNNLYTIMPFIEAKGEPSGIRFGNKLPRRDTSSTVIQIVPLKYISALQMTNLLRPFIFRNGYIWGDNVSNYIIINDVASNMDKLLEMISIFDIDIFSQAEFRLFPLTHAEAQELARELEEIFNTYDLIKRPQQGFGIKILSIPRINSILALSSTKELLDYCERWVKQLDREIEGVEPIIFVYRVEYGLATDMAQLLGQIFGGETGPPKERREARRRLGIVPVPAPGAPAQPPGAPTPGQQPSQQLIGEVGFFADEPSNSLVIRAIPSDYRIIKNTIKMLDIRPKQVLIDVLFIEITLSEDLSLGLQSILRFERSQASVGEIGTNFSLVPNAPGGLSFAFLNPEDVSALLNALASQSKSRVLSHPHILVSNNKEAIINVGDQVPIVTGEFAQIEAIGAVTPTVARNVQFRETGVILTVTPHINSENFVTLDVQQEVSDARRTTTSGIDTPTINTRKTQTTALMDDGQTILIAGLMSENSSKTKSKVPFLGDVPLMGRLFSSVNDTMAKTELIILITPMVVDTLEQVNLMTEDFKRKVRSLQEAIKSEMKKKEKGLKELMELKKKQKKEEKREREKEAQ